MLVSRGSLFFVDGLGGSDFCWWSRGSDFVLVVYGGSDLFLVVYGGSDLLLVVYGGCDFCLVVHGCFFVGGAFFAVAWFAHRSGL